MNIFLNQVILAARNRDAESWMQMLVFVVFIVIYALGSIVKAKSNKVEQDNEDQLGRKQPRKPPEPLRRLHRERQPQAGVRDTLSQQGRREPQAQPARRSRRVPRPQPAPERSAAQVQPSLEHVLETPELPDLSLEPIRPVQPAIKKLPEFTKAAIDKLKAQPQGATSEEPGSKRPREAEPILRYTDIDDLRRAILHYEILGRPLSLRDPSQRNIEF